jgi:molybdenum cofactor cytidylyltransferase
MKCAGLILAAGESSRMGSEKKLLMPFDGKPMVNHVLNAAMDSNLDHTCVVVGHDASKIKTLIGKKRIQIVENESWTSGMASSIVAGVQQLNKYDGILILLGDMPLVSSELINEIINHGTPDKIVVPAKKGRQGNPVFFGSKFMYDLMRLEGDRGAKSLIQKNRSLVMEIEVQSDAIFKDFDTHESLRAGIGVA